MNIEKLLRGLVVAGLTTACACAAAPPLGYSDGVRWQVPLVAPLDGLGCVSVRRDPERGLIAVRDPRAPRQAFDIVLQPVDGAGRPLPGLLRARVAPDEVKALTRQMRRISGQVVDYRVMNASPYSAHRRTRVSQVPR